MSVCWRESVVSVSNLNMKYKRYSYVYGDVDGYCQCRTSMLRKNIIVTDGQASEEVEEGVGQRTSSSSSSEEPECRRAVLKRRIGRIN